MCLAVALYLPNFRNPNTFRHNSSLAIHGHLSLVAADPMQGLRCDFGCHRCDSGFCMGRDINRLTNRQVASFKSLGCYADGGGLYLKITNDGLWCWVFIYEKDGRRREMGFGPAAGPNKVGISLADARRKAENARRLRFDGRDPFTEARAARDASKT